MSHELIVLPLSYCLVLYNFDGIVVVKLPSVFNELIQRKKKKGVDIGLNLVEIGMTLGKRVFFLPCLFSIS